MTTKATSIWRKSLPTYAVICTSFALSACQTPEEQRDADWDRQVQQTRDQTRADADAWRSGTGPYANQSFGTSGGNSDTTMPSAAGIDGMECTGTGDDAVCNAR